MNPTAANSQTPPPVPPGGTSPAPKISQEEMLKQGKEEIRKAAAPVLQAVKPMLAKLSTLLHKAPAGPPPPPGVQPPKPPGPPVSLPKRIGAVFAGLVLLCLIAFLTIGSLATYTKTKLPISEEQRKGLLVLMYNVPLTPKTPEQILIVAIDKNAKVITASPNFSFSAIVDATNVKLANLDVKVQGKLDFTPDKKLAMDLKFNAAAALGESAFDISGAVRKKENNVYYKIEKLPDYILGYLTPITYETYGVDISDAEKKEIKAKQQKVMENWIKYEESEGLDTEARKNAEKDNKSFITDMQNDAQEFLLKSNTLPEVQREKDENINGVATYHLTLKPSKKLIKKILVDYAVSKADKSTYVANPKDDFGAFVDSIQSVQIDMWIGKNDTIVRKLSLKSVISLASLQKSLGNDTANPLPLELFGASNAEKAVNPKITVSTVLITDAVNEPVTIDVPKPVLTYEQYYDKLTEVSKTKSQLAADQKLGVFKKDAFTIRYLLSKYYIQNGSYPEKLADLGSVTQPTDPTLKQLANYSYKTSADKKNYIVYAEVTSGVPSLTYYTPYYGFSSTSQEVHQMLTYEFDDLYRTTSSPSLQGGGSSL